MWQKRGRRIIMREDGLWMTIVRLIVVKTKDDGVVAHFFLLHLEERRDLILGQKVSFREMCCMQVVLLSDKGVCRRRYRRSIHVKNTSGED